MRKLVGPWAWEMRAFVKHMAASLGASTSTLCGFNNPKQDLHWPLTEQKLVGEREAAIFLHKRITLGTGKEQCCGTSSCLPGRHRLLQKGPGAEAVAGQGRAMVTWPASAVLTSHRYCLKRVEANHPFGQMGSLSKVTKPVSREAKALPTEWVECMAVQAFLYKWNPVLFYGVTSTALPPCIVFYTTLVQ